MAEAMQDQAEGLRRLLSDDFVRIVTLTSGKRSVGKTTVLINLAVALARRGKQVMLLDEHQGKHSVVGMLGLTPYYNLTHVLRREQSLEQVMLSGPEGIMVVPSGRSVQELANLSASDMEWLVRSFAQLAQPMDVVLVDAVAGVAGNVLPLSLAAQELVVVVDPQPASMTDAYALIKVLNQGFARRNFHIVVNRVASPEEAGVVFSNMAKVAKRFLKVSLDFMGFVPQEEKIHRATQLGRTVVDAFPDSTAAQAFRDLAEKMEQWPHPAGEQGQMEVFMQRLVQSSRATAAEPSRTGRA
ncbi:site-determining protein [Sulfurimicrobium lacus]|uniref:Site-determining protein n=1 Tax=Sulfurimicrobium lacus TaxID=2715678 RepID=A0A6F8VC33_9PROT|nr:P-loop NTPase [Sulfurimicrobium lacus]BCB26701.1 site-determining protein [Sulfurimicrobium lacus]